MKGSTPVPCTQSSCQARNGLEETCKLYTDNFIDTYYYYVFIERQIVVKTKQNI